MGGGCVSGDIPSHVDVEESGTCRAMRWPLHRVLGAIHVGLVKWLIELDPGDSRGLLVHKITVKHSHFPALVCFQRTSGHSDTS